MSYYQEGLEGTGVPLDPFIINSYEDWLKIDARKTGLDEPAPYYKLTNDIDMHSEHTLFKGANFLGGTLLMDNHSILNPKVEIDEFVIRFCNIIGGPLELLAPSGKIVKVGGEGKITNIKGNKVKNLFHKCYIERMFIEIDSSLMWFDDGISLTGQMAGLQSYIRVNNTNPYDESRFAGPFISCLPMERQKSFKDCCFEFNGNAFDYPLIDQFYDSTDPEVILDHCMVCGDLDCSDMRWHYNTPQAPYMIGGGIRSCAFDVNGKGARDEQGYRDFAMAFDDSCGSSIAVRHSGLYVGGNTVERVSDQDFRDTNKLLEKEFDVIRTR